MKSLDYDDEYGNTIGTQFKREENKSNSSDVGTYANPNTVSHK